MPENIKMSENQKKIWNSAKNAAEKQGKKDDYAYIMQIYKNMSGIKKEASAGDLTRRIANKLKNIATFKDLIRATREKTLFDSQSVLRLKDKGFNQSSEIADLARTRRKLDDFIDMETNKMNSLNKYTGQNKDLNEKVKSALSEAKGNPDLFNKSNFARKKEIKRVQDAINDLKEAREELSNRIDQHRDNLGAKWNNSVGAVTGLYGVPIIGGYHGLKKIKGDKNKET